MAKKTKKQKTKNKLQATKQAVELSEQSTTAGTVKNGNKVLNLLQQKWVVMGLLFLAALVIRLINVFQMKANSPFFEFPSVDSKLYDQLAQKIITGDWLGEGVFYYNPFYSYFLAFWYKIFGVNHLAVKVIQSLLGSVSCVLVYLIGRRLFNHKVAALAGLFAAFYGVLIFYDELLLATVVSIFGILSAILLLLKTEDTGSKKMYAAAGSAIGFAFLSRPTFLPFIAFFWLCYSLRHKPKEQILIRLAITVGFAALMIAPVTIRNYVVGDDLVLISSHTGYNFYLANHPESKGRFKVPSAVPSALADDTQELSVYFHQRAEAELGKKLKPSEASSYWSKMGWQFIFDDPLRWVSVTAKKFMFLINEFEFSDNQSYYFSKQYSFVLRGPTVGFAMICPLALLGLILCFRSWRKLLLVYLFIVGYSGGLILFYIQSRYRLLMVPLLVLFAAYAVFWMVEQLQKQNYGAFLKAAGGLAFFFVLTFLTAFAPPSKEPKAIDYYNLGNRYFSKKQWDKAIDNYKLSISLDPGYISAYNNLANSYVSNNDHRNAIKQWEKVLELGKKINSPLHIKRSQRFLKKLKQKK